MKPWLADPDVTLWHGDALHTLRELPSASVDCCVTSPPYLGLRDYGHPDQIGLEPTLGEYVAALTAVFAEVRRVLTDTGTLWLNLGDSYNAYNGGAGPGSKLSKIQTAARPRLASGFGLQQKELKPKDLMGVPWRVAFALQADGWYLRSDIIWSKPNPMPESVTDRPTKAHEYVFLLSKSPRYFFDQDAIREPHESTRWGGRYHDAGPDEKYVNGDTRIAAVAKMRKDRPRFDHYPDGGRNVRSVWEIATQPYPDAHFAVFPEELARRCILAGVPQRVCERCGAASERLTERAPNLHPGDSGRNDVQGSVQRGRRPDGKAVGTIMRERHEAGRGVTTLGWSDCGHNDYRPGRVLDPFGGSGTTALVARKHGRRAVLIELSDVYCMLAAKRLQQLSLLAEPA